MEYFPFICVLFLSSVSYGFKYSGLSPPWLSLFLGILLFCAIVNGNVFLISLLGSSLLVCRNTTYLCILILCPETLPNLFISSNSFWCGGVFRVFSI